MLLTVDTSVIIASLIEKEEHHVSCKRLMEKVSNGEHTALLKLMTSSSLEATILSYWFERVVSQDHECQ